MDEERLLLTTLPPWSSVGEAMADIGALVAAGKLVHKEDIRECDILTMLMCSSTSSPEGTRERSS